MQMTRCAAKFTVPFVLLVDSLFARSAYRGVEDHYYSDGWIGSWTPGIGDPSFIGWITVVSYLIAAWYCYRLVRDRQYRWRDHETRLWCILALGLLFLGINKQLDLQTALTEAGRLLAREQGWYRERSTVQMVFLFLLFVLGAMGAMSVFRLTRRTSRYAQMAVIGAFLLMAYVMLRAISFHYVDHLLREELAGLRFSWILELGGILIIFISARRKFSERKRADARVIRYSKSRFY